MSLEGREGGYLRGHVDAAFDALERIRSEVEGLEAHGERIVADNGNRPPPDPWRAAHHGLIETLSNPAASVQLPHRGESRGGAAATDRFGRAGQDRLFDSERTPSGLDQATRASLRRWAGRPSAVERGPRETPYGCVNLLTAPVAELEAMGRQSFVRAGRLGDSYRPRPGKTATDHLSRAYADLLAVNRRMAQYSLQMLRPSDLN
ncbi:hypothetical protein DIPPA_01754 [Diplonema papillatum]|nr:hypothetical protein DIPPA_01754 [Diplonema papillatum]